MQNKTVLIIHQKIASAASPDEADVLVQLEAIEKALIEIGFCIKTLPFSLNLGKMRTIISRIKPIFVFNLVESIENTSGLLHLAPALLDHMQIRYTGASTESLMLTTNKVIAKQLMRAKRLPTAPWITSFEGDLKKGVEYICKPVSEEASIGIDQSSIRSFDDRNSLMKFFREKQAKYNTPFFFEEYVDGREFNISIIQNGSAIQVLPPAEIKFDDAAGMNRKIVDYDAKWNINTAAYKATNRSFEVDTTDAALLASLKKISEQCWCCFSLRDYARVDFRVDNGGNPFILEINANPCIAPDSGFYAAATSAGLTYTQMIERIIDNCIRQE